VVSVWLVGKRAWGYTSCTFDAGCLFRVSVGSKRRGGEISQDVPLGRKKVRAKEKERTLGRDRSVDRGLR
jgi:hypothetical protein